MKKFKLIKSYPSSPKVGTVVFYDDTNFFGTTFKYECDKYPEYWEEVVEKDYEILTLIEYKTKRILVTKGMISGRMDMLIGLGWGIHSIKRLSDGQVFTVGDEITTKASESYCSIYRFKTFNDKLRIEHTHSFLLDQKFPETKYEHHLHLIELKKQPVLTTEDGVALYKGDEYYTVFTMNDYRYKTWATQNKPFIIDEDASRYLHKDIKYFSTKEKAEEYIIMNKPCLSIKEIKEVSSFTGSPLNIIGIIESTLRNLVKSKV